MPDHNLPRHATEMLRAEPGHRLVFVFDALMDISAIREHCPTVRVITTAAAKNHALTFTIEGATMYREPGDTVYGLLYEMSEPELARLDSHLGTGSLRERRATFVQAADGRLASADFYRVQLPCLGPLRPDQALRLSEIGRRLGFPRAYLDQIRAWIGTVH